MDEQLSVNHRPPHSGIGGNKGDVAPEYVERCLKDSGDIAAKARIRLEIKARRALLPEPFQETAGRPVGLPGRQMPRAKADRTGGFAPVSRWKNPSASQNATALQFISASRTQVSSVPVRSSANRMSGCKLRFLHIRI